MEELDKLLAALPNSDKVTTEMKQAALNGSLIPDPDGIWPGQVGYVTTHDVYWAAINLMPFMQAQPQVTSASSEGTSVTATRFDWDAIASFYRGMSVIVGANPRDVLNLVAIPDVPHVRRVPMNDRGGYYGDVDTDLG